MTCGDAGKAPTINSATSRGFFCADLASIKAILLAKSPLHAWMASPRFPGRRPVKRTYREDMAIGNAAHKLLLGRGKDLAVLAFDNMMSGDAKKARDAAWATGREPVDSAKKKNGPARKGK